MSKPKKTTRGIPLALLALVWLLCQSANVVALELSDLVNSSAEANKAFPSEGILPATTGLISGDFKALTAKVEPSLTDPNQSRMNIRSGAERVKLVNQP